jgi:hypothetical protein
MAFKSTHVDWYPDDSATVHHEHDNDSSQDIKHGANKGHDVLVSIQKHIGAKPGLPPYERYGEKVPHGGSKCANCEYLADNKKDCNNENFIAWDGPNKPAGDPTIPGKIDEYCSIWWEEK